MNKLIVLITLLISSSYSYSQNHSIGLSAGHVFSGRATDFESLAGASSYHHKSGSQLSLNYKLQLSKNITLLSGLQLQQLSMEAQNGSSTAELQTWDFNVDNLNIPLYANLSFFKYFFIEGGPILNFQINEPDPYGIDNQNGIGISAGIGAQYDIGKLNFFLKSQAQMQALVPFNSEKYHERLITNSLSLGVYYQL
ncbi:Outer membrane protein beta-barrel domain-containing protein [Marivirga sericea]|uniref:Outer membrane protein beta-barrel domain-containing protein n=1 Tax=Marivirga sericea TaxID=1028 RepID=A0A1X7IZ26_9BACT|nr:outer membrane beta-barrel protein [Marivirga sericea]SMG20537.1 Outer membrane protein beta-barrel domain-containing protein [Marivirga sericea]